MKSIENWVVRKTILRIPILVACGILYERCTLNNVVAINVNINIDIRWSIYNDESDLNNFALAAKFMHDHDFSPSNRFIFLMVRACGILHSRLDLQHCYANTNTVICCRFYIFCSLFSLSFICLEWICAHKYFCEGHTA